MDSGFVLSRRVIGSDGILGVVIMRRILFSLLIFMSAVAWAEDDYYYWRTTNVHGSNFYQGIEGPNPLQTCINAIRDAREVTGVRPASNSRTFACEYTTSSGSSAALTYVTRYGSSCPPDTTYNSETGACDEPEPDECEELEGISRNFRRSGTAPDAFMFIFGNNYAYDQNICVNSCSATVVGANCTVSIDGPYTCVGISRFTGTSCTAGPGGADPDTSSDETDETEPPQPERVEENKPCNYITAGDGTQTCISEHTEQNDGSCGTFNGEVICNPDPEKTDKKIETTVETETNPDGSTTTTKTDTLTTNHCVGANACTTTTTTVTTTTRTNGNGEVESVSGTCTGPQCPDRYGNPDGDGDGFGDCIGPMCGEDEEATFEGGELGDVKDFGESAQDFMDRARNAPIMQAISGIAFPSGGSCGFGAASTSIGVISLDGMCDNSHWLDPLYPIFLAVWCFAALRKFMEA